MEDFEDDDTACWSSVVQTIHEDDLCLFVDTKDSLMDFIRVIVDNFYSTRVFCCCYCYYSDCGWIFDTIL